MILVGEIRDIDTARMALSASETGIWFYRRCIHVMPRDRFLGLPIFFRSRFRGGSIAIGQLLANGGLPKLLPSSIVGEKQELALEIMTNVPAIASAIRTGKLESIDNYI